jgi:hypothetical protein
MIDLQWLLNGNSPDHHNQQLACLDDGWIFDPARS